jgi:hypothetical protein
MESGLQSGMQLVLDDDVDSQGPDLGTPLVSVSESMMAELPEFEELASVRDPPVVVDGEGLLSPRLKGEAAQLFRNLNIEQTNLSNKEAKHFIEYTEHLKAKLNQESLEPKEKNIIAAMVAICAQILGTVGFSKIIGVPRFVYPTVKAAMGVAAASFSALQSIAPSVVDIFKNLSWPLESIIGKFAGEKALIALTLMSFILWARKAYPKAVAVQIGVNPMDLGEGVGKFLEDELERLKADRSAQINAEMMEKAILSYDRDVESKKLFETAKQILNFAYEAYSSCPEGKKEALRTEMLNAIRTMIDISKGDDPSILQQAKKSLDSLGGKILEPIKTEEFMEVIENISTLEKEITTLEGIVATAIRNPANIEHNATAIQNLQTAQEEMVGLIEKKQTLLSVALKALGNFVPGSFIAGKIRDVVVGMTQGGAQAVRAARNKLDYTIRMLDAVLKTDQDVAAQYQKARTQRKINKDAAAARAAVRAARAASNTRDDTRRGGPRARSPRGGGAQGGSRRRKKLSRKQRNKRKTIRRKVVKKSVRKKSLRKTKKRKTKRMRR